MTILYAKQLPAQSFKPTTPAKLASLSPITFTLEAGSGGNLKVYALHLNDRLTAWSSLADVAGVGTLIATLTASGNSDAISFTPGPNEEILFWFAFDDAGGAPPALLSMSMPWVSDVTAPAAPNIALITPIIPDGGTVGYRADFALPATARHVILEGRKNAGSWLLFTDKAKMEASGTYMKFRGDLSAVELSGERNETHLSFAKGLTAGDSVEIRIAAEDDVGNRSAFTASDPVTLEAQTSGAAPVFYIEDASVDAGGSGTINVHLVGISLVDVTVVYASTDDTAVEGGDYTGIGGTLTFAGDAVDGHRVQTIAINGVGANNQAGTSAYTIELSASSGPAIERASGTVSVVNAAAPITITLHGEPIQTKLTSQVIKTKVS